MKMKTPLLAVLIVSVLIVGSALSAMNKACKSVSRKNSVACVSLSN
jgi:hypothetical protein